MNRNEPPPNNPIDNSIPLCSYTEGCGILEEEEMKNLTETALLSRGFEKVEWKDEGETFVEYVKKLRNATKIEISGLNLVELVIEDAYETANIESLKELDLLIKMFEI